MLTMQYSSGAMLILVQTLHLTIQVMLTISTGAMHNINACSANSRTIYGDNAIREQCRISIHILQRTVQLMLITYCAVLSLTIEHNRFRIFCNIKCNFNRDLWLLFNVNKLYSKWINKVQRCKDSQKEIV
jgi:hypothetical protein